MTEISLQKKKFRCTISTRNLRKKFRCTLSTKICEFSINTLNHKNSMRWNINIFVYWAINEIICQWFEYWSINAFIYQFLFIDQWTRWLINERTLIDQWIYWFMNEHSNCKILYLVIFTRVNYCFHHCDIFLSFSCLDLIDLQIFHSVSMSQ